MKYLFSLLFFSFTLLFPLNVLAETKEKVPPVQNDWDKGEDGDRTLSSMPSLLRDVNSVYAYSEKELDNVTIGITDMQGNVYYEEVTTVPAGIYYAISIESLPVGQYYFYIYQGSNYVIGMFTKD